MSVAEELVTGAAITGCDRAGSLDGVTVFHAGADLGSARAKVDEAMDEISSLWMQRRSDIAVGA